MAEEADLTGIIVQDNDPSSPPEGIFATEQEREMEEAARKKEYGYTHPTMDDYRPEFDDPNFVEDFDESAMDAWELEQERLREEATKEEIQDVEEPLPEIVEEEVVENLTIVLEQKVVDATTFLVAESQTIKNSQFGRSIPTRLPCLEEEDKGIYHV